MQQAHKQLIQNDMTVSEVAFQCGYENVGHFIRAFRNEYGKTPGQVKKQVAYYV